MQPEMQHHWFEIRRRTWLKSVLTEKKQQRKCKKALKQREFMMMGGFLEMSCSRVLAEYFEHLGKRRRRIFVHEVWKGEHSACV